MAKWRMTFIKEAQASYISHLDLMRTFQRDFLRAGLVVKHSQGFHPHPLMSILLPLSVGQSSECELMEFETEGELPAALVETMNGGMPLGLTILDCFPAVKPARELQALRATVELDYDGGVPAGAAGQIAGLLERPALVIEKKTKHRELAEVDIRPMLHSLVVTEGENRLTLEVLVQAQNPGLNPGLLGAAIARELPALTPDFVRVRRRALLDGEGKAFR